MFCPGFETGDVKWFEDGTLNTCYNCLDRHVNSGNGDKTAIIYEADEAGDVTRLSYKEALARVCQVGVGSVIVTRICASTLRICLTSITLLHHRSPT